MLKKFINDPKNVVEEMLEGFLAAHQGEVRRLETSRVVVRKEVPIKEIISLYRDKGWSENRVAKYFKVSRGLIRNRLLKSGVHIRNLSESEKLLWSQRSVSERKNQISNAHKTLPIARGVRKPMSKVESMFLKAFEANGISVVCEYPFGRYNLDFAIPSKKIAIEVNVGNWHDSRTIPDGRKKAFLTRRKWRLIIFEIRRSTLSVIVGHHSKDIKKIIDAIYSTPSIWCKDRVVSSHPI